jgi:hypothetical protein
VIWVDVKVELKLQTSLFVSSGGSFPWHVWNENSQQVKNSLEK